VAVRGEGGAGAAALYSVSLRSIDYLIADGRIHVRRIGGRSSSPTKSYFVSAVMTGTICWYRCGDGVP
jgi:hypothetical protein